MHVDPRHAAARAHISNLVRGDDEDAMELLRALVLGCWPGEGSDRAVSDAPDRLRVWGRVLPEMIAPSCECAHGSCVLCN